MCAHLKTYCAARCWAWLRMLGKLPDDYLRYIYDEAAE